MQAPTTIKPMSVLVPDGETWETVKVLRCLARAPALTVHILSRDRSPLARFSRYCSSCHHHTSENDAAWLRRIGGLARRLRIDVILPVTEKGVDFVVRNREAICEFAAVPPLPGLGPLRTVQNKWSLYRFGKERGLPVAPSLYVGNGTPGTCNLGELGSIAYPALLKPTSMAGGYGIVRVESPSDFQQALQDNRIMKGQEYMLQSYIPGNDLCLHVFCKNGEILAHAVQKALAGPDDYFGPQRVMEFVDDKEALDLGSRLVAALGWDGIACIDFRMDVRDRTLKILEVNPRFCQATLGCLLAGVSLPLLACLGAIGADHPDVQYKATRYAHPMPAGRILLSQLLGRRTPVKIMWSESGLQFTLSDPLPEVVDVARRTARRLRRKTGSGR